MLRNIQLLYDRDTETTTKPAGTTGNSVMSYALEQGAATQTKINREERAVQQSALGTRMDPIPQSGAWNSRPAHTAWLELYYGNDKMISRGVDPALTLETAGNILIHSSVLILSPRTQP